MVSRTRIPTGMFPVGGSETDPTPRTATPSAITKDGSGEPINEEMIQDYPCGEEAGHYFISSPLNVYSIGRSGAVVLYVEGGCPNFTWASDNAWATFGTATTSVRYNTISSTSAEGQDTVVTVTDANGLEVTISVPWNGAATCCDDPPALSIQTPVAEIVGEFAVCEVVVFIDGGCPPFAWVTTTTSGTATLDYAATNSRRNRITGTAPCWTLTVTDYCDQTATIGVYPIVMSVLDSYEFDEDYCLGPQVVQLANTEYYAVIYEGPDDDGWIRTFNIPEATGVITEIDSYEYTTVNGASCNIAHITGDIYAVTNATTYLSTIAISSTGAITKTIQDTVQIHVGATKGGLVVHVAGSVYAVFWQHGLGEHAFTYNIAANGAIAFLDGYNSGIGYSSTAAGKVTDGVYYTVRLSDWGDFIVATYAINDAGVVTDEVIDQQELSLDGPNAVSHGRTCVVEVASNIYVMTHRDENGVTLATFQINDNGSIETSTIDELLIDDSGVSGDSPWIVYSGSGTVYCVILQSVAGDGFVYLVSITDAGEISNYSPCGETSFEFEETNLGSGAVALSPQGDMLPIFYPGPDDDGWIKTIDLDRD